MSLRRSDKFLLTLSVLPTEKVSNVLDTTFLMSGLRRKKSSTAIGLISLNEIAKLYNKTLSFFDNGVQVKAWVEFHSI